MKKEIYIIKNKINDFVYIGQAVNSKTRWAGHRSHAKHQSNNSLIDKAIYDLGLENFWYEVLEVTENYDERERYWIQYFNCVFPNGYNFLPGGDGAQVGVDSANASIRDQKIIEFIIHDLSYTKIPLTEIAQKYNTTLKLISAINRGTSYSDNKYTYPLRARPVDKINELNIVNLIEDLINTDVSYRQLAKKYNITSYLVQQINNGKKFFDEKYSYPLRVKKEDPRPEKVRNLLRTSNYSMHEIAKICGISYSMVAQINVGKYHFVDTETYPIR